MMGAFYAGKHFTHYARMLQDGEIRLTAWADIVAALRADMAAFSVDIIAAYNAGFDFRVIAQTHADLGFSGAIIESPRSGFGHLAICLRDKIATKAIRQYCAFARLGFTRWQYQDRRGVCLSFCLRRSLFY